MLLVHLPQVMEVVELIRVHNGKVVARVVVHGHPREPRVPAAEISMRVWAKPNKMGNPSNGPATKNWLFCINNNGKYKYPGCMGKNWELLRKDMGTCCHDSTKMVPYCPNWELVGKEFGTFQDVLSPPNQVPPNFFGSYRLGGFAAGKNNN